MIKGIGLDIVELERISSLYTRQPNFESRILVRAELEQCARYAPNRKIEYLAGRFAAKEAFAKALGTGIGQQFTWHDIAILNEDSGAPHIHWTSAGKEQPEFTMHLSISHSSEFAVAQVILEL